MAVKILFVSVFLMFSISQASGSNCDNQKAEYWKLLTALLKKSQQCTKDEDCILHFDGSKLSSCDLGNALSKNTISASIFKKLETLKKKVEKQCPQPTLESDGCAAMPSTKVFCNENNCLTQ